MMLPISRTIMLVIMSLAVVVQCTEGNQRIVHVSELISDDDNFFTNGEGDNSHNMCCVYGNCTCTSLNHALANLTSNVLINITTDVMLSSLIETSGLQNVSIIGHNNPTVNCKHVGGIHFIFCHNCIIQHITWDGCGNKNATNRNAEPGIKLNHSSNVAIQNCTFQHSIGQALVLTEVSGDININNCNFVNNSHYRGHGAAIHYSFMHNVKMSSYNQFLFTITNCNFSNNRNVKSLVYIRNILMKYHKISIINSIFNSNQGISVHVINHKINLKGEVLFYSNVAEDGAAVYISGHSTVTFGENSNITFSQNLANGRGGAVFLRIHSTCVFNHNSIVTFIYNKATKGGAIYSEDNSNITFKESCKVIFTSNLATQHGAAIYSSCNSHIKFTGNTWTTDNSNVMLYNKTTDINYSFNISFENNFSVMFCSNSANHGGAVHCENNCHITFAKTSTVVFSSNRAYSAGGAIYSYDNSHTSFEVNSTTVFSNNTALWAGGAIRSVGNSHISFQGNSVIHFSNNFVNISGGAIHSHDNSYISFEGNSVIHFSNNYAVISGGAIMSYVNSYISFEGNSTTMFSCNTVIDKGAAIRSSVNSYLSFKGNSVTEFSKNTAVSESGTIYSNGNSYISFEENSVTKFSNNTARSNGGAICSHDNSYISFEGNSVTTFSDNVAGADGGAIHSRGYSYISFKGDTPVVFNNNAAESGGALCSKYKSYIFFKGKSFTVFIYNNAKYGGTIFSYQNSCISFEGNSLTVLYNNVGYYGGGILLHDSSFINFKENSTTVFNSNVAVNKGGSILADAHCIMTFDYNSSIQFVNNTATFGAAIFCIRDSKIIVKVDSSITFNNLSPKWCAGVCLPYPGETDAIMIDSNGIVWCNNLKAFICISDKCYCKGLKTKFKNDEVVNIIDEVVVLSSVIQISSRNVSIIGHNNPTVMCIKKSGLKILKGYNLTIKGITWIGCGATEAMYAVSNEYIPVIEITISSNIVIYQCHFKYSVGQVISITYVSGYVNITNCRFAKGNYHRGHGTAIAIRKVNVFTINNCVFSSNSGAKSVIYMMQHRFEHSIIYLINSTFYNNEGASIYLSKHYILIVIGEILFKNNVAEDGAGVYISDHSTVIFGENSNIKFCNNSSYHNGAGIFLHNNSSAIFDSNSEVTFTDNRANNGTIYSKFRSSVIFRATCKVIFNRNSATRYGAAIYSFDNSQVIFTGNSTATFSGNFISFNDIHFNKIDTSFDDIHLQHGGTILSEKNGYIVFKEKSIATFSNNSAGFGAVIFSICNSDVLFKDSSVAVLNNNIAHYCGILTIAMFSNITFTDNTKVTYDTNKISTNYKTSTGTVCSFQESKITFTGHSLVRFINNKADRGGAVIIFESNVIIGEYSTVLFNSNFALYSSGGAFVCSNYSNVTIQGNSNVTFNNNKATQSGGAIHSYNMCRVTFKGNSTSTFTNNIARDDGGAIFSSLASEITFKGSSVIIFDGNTADNGGVFYISNCSVTFKESSLILFYNNKARECGGVGCLYGNSQMRFQGTTTVRFENNLANQIAGVLYSVKSNIVLKENSTITVNNNKATLNGGALHFENNSDIIFTDFTNVTFHHNRAICGGAILANDHCNITVTGNSVLFFASNKATERGGAGYFNHGSDFIIKENSHVNFDYNKALEGGAVYIICKTKFTMKGNCTIYFSNNLGTIGGGAIKVLNDSKVTLKDHINIKFTSNKAQYGGAIFLDTSAVMVNSSYKNCIVFKNNIARVTGNLIYQDVTELCNRSCLNNKTDGITSELIATPPSILKFNDSAMCIDNDNDTECTSYYIQDIMLGTEIVIPACVLDYYDKPVDSTHFLVQSEIYSNYIISGSKETFISCDTFKGISIIGNQSLSKAENFSINITLNIALNSNWKQISVNMIIELSPCHPGFWQYPKSGKCECYNARDIVFCSGSSSTIKRGYWFGSVIGKPTVTFCPINYCNFTCCETSNGYYHLSPVRDNQCRSHRSGTACGSCEEGYTLPFDSAECVHVKQCSIGWTILVITLIVFYWIIIIIVVFSLMHFKVGIGYLYVISYYYSVVDLMLSQNWYHSDAVYVTISVVSSIVKVVPQFIGQFCFIKNMSGIDQQFIHYIHPVALSLFLVMVTVLARRSHRLSFFISKGIIHVICCLLLLSYTSLATTSLLLMRPLIFHDVDKVYTYVSPDVEYFHGRHLVYAIVAVLFTTAVVVGLPLILALEPFLNSKFNFVKVKPLLDQFQGCYKDKYRCFAAYYMICRLIIITIIIANSSNDYAFQYLLVIACVMMDITHQIIKPYLNSVLNIFDGVILHFIVLVSVLPLAEIHNDFDPDLAEGIKFIYVLLPLLIFITMSLIINKDKLKSLPGYCYLKCSQLYLSCNRNELPLNEIPLIKTEQSSNEYINIIDDSKRKNVTICDV